jgi:hypothetical protein
VRELGQTERVVVLTEVQGAHQRVDLRSAARPEQRAGGVGSLVLAVILALRAVLRGALRGVGRQLADELAKALHAGFEALGIDGERRLPRGDFERALLEHVALVDAGCHQVPTDAVARFSLDQCPRGRIEARITWQRAIVEVDGRTSWKREHIIRENRQVRDREQVVEGLTFERGLVVGIGRNDGHSALTRPLFQARIRRDDRPQIVTVLDQDLGALDQKRVPTDYVTTEFIRVHVYEQRACNEARERRGKAGATRLTCAGITPKWATVTSRLDACKDRPNRRRSAIGALETAPSDCTPLWDAPGSVLTYVTRAAVDATASIALGRTKPA